MTTLDKLDIETFQSALLNCLKVSSAEEIGEICHCLGFEYAPSNLSASGALEERKQADLDQYADEVIRMNVCHSEMATFLDLSRVVPLRLEYSERKFLRLLESTIDSSEYTDRVDVSGVAPHRHTVLVLRNICSLLSGLVIGHDANAVDSVLKERDFTKFAHFYRTIFEIGRRYKILNPERMQHSYFKMMYLLQDLKRCDVAELFDFGFDKPVDTVYSLLSNGGGLALLADPFIDTATAEIMPQGKTKWKVQEEIKIKEQAIKRLSVKYSAAKASRSFFSSRAGDDDDLPSATLSREQVERCIYSICDFKTFLRFNQTPCERMIVLLEKYFANSQTCLAIAAGVDGARLSHSHSRQYTFVLQSLTLWAEVMKEMFILWHKAEEDLLDCGVNPYVCTQTGQGMQRVQQAPRVHLAMKKILAKVQQRLGGWVGSSTIHLGDANVPNALIFIDKYMQVPKILGPIVLCIDKIQDAKNYSAGLAQVISTMGGPDVLCREILQDFFQHGFDGSGGDTFFEAGSCVDGRLTSAWNWCSKIETKSFYPVFQLTGFVGFDSK